ncbi:MAG: putative transposase, partial [Bacteroidia bacterium]
DFVIMPNHLHGIIKIIHRGECNSPRNTESCSEIGGESHSPKNVNSIDKGECNSPRRCNSPRQTVGAIVRGYKSAVTKQLNQINIGCAVWQRNYHEHIIRTDKALYNISKYIRNNSQKWAEDQFNGK